MANAADLSVPAPAQRLTGLDTLRAIAIAHVVLAHGAMTFLPELQGWGGRVVWVLIAVNLGVPLFFVLSGFLITRQLASGMPWPTFYRHRLAKIYPTFALAVLVYGALNNVTAPLPWALHVAALQNVSANLSGRMSGHLWSLAVEMQFYVIAPVLYACVYRWLNWRTVVALSVLSWLAHAAVLLGAAPTQDARLTALLNVYQYTSFNLIALMMGAWLYRAFSSGQQWRAAAPIGLLAAAGMPAICAWVVPSLQVTRVDLRVDAHLLALLGLIALPPIASVCLAHLTLRNHWFTRTAWPKMAGFVAVISYQWYLWHPLVLMGFHWAAVRWPSFDAAVRGWPWVALAVYAVLSAALGWAAQRLVEQPLQRWLLRSLKRRASQVA